MLFPFHFVIDRISCMIMIAPKLVGTAEEVFGNLRRRFIDEMAADPL